MDSKIPEFILVPGFCPLSTEMAQFFYRISFKLPDNSALVLRHIDCMIQSHGEPLYNSLTILYQEIPLSLNY